MTLNFSLGMAANSTEIHNGTWPGILLPPAYKINYEEEARCMKVMEKDPPQDGRAYCPAVFDGWMCWDYTPAGSTNYQLCPHDFKPEMNPDGFAHKICHDDATWFVHPESNKTWTNYLGCDFKYQSLPLFITITGYAISCILLAISIGIFTYFKQLRCTRVALHEHLFVSFILTGILWVISYAVFMDDPERMAGNGVWCKVLHVLTQYVSVSNYFWMFCEGFFLHTIIVQAFSKQKKLLHMCLVIGWGLPLLPVIAYLIARMMDTKNNASCWIHPTWSIWILIAPIGLSLLLNMGMLLNVLRILLSKIRAFNGAEQSQYSRAAKAILILIPLLGIQNLLTPAKPELNRKEMLIWNSISAFLISFQGAAVALIFCILNGEVLAALKRCYRQWRHLHDPTFTGRPATSTTMAMTIDETTAAAADPVYKNGKAGGNKTAAWRNNGDGEAAEMQLMMPGDKLPGKVAL